MVILGYNGQLLDSKCFFCRICTFHALCIFLMLMLILIFVVCVDFNDRFKRRFEQCKKTIQAANNRQASKDVADLLAYETIYWHTILPPCTSKARLRSVRPSVWNG